jgi:hypothetical protein
MYRKREMGTLYTELQKWLKSPLEKEVRYKGKIPNPPTVKGHAKEAGKKELKNASSVKGSTSGNVINLSNEGYWPHIISGPDTPYLVGQYAIDVATLANLHVQSLAYKTGHSPLLLPWALRYSPEQAYLDLGKLDPWDQWRVLWSRVGAHFFQDFYG